MPKPSPLPYIKNLPPYVPGRAAIEGADKIYKLSANENLLGASPKVHEALADFATPEFYPDGSTTALRAQLAQLHDINADQIICGNGSGEIFHLLGQAYLSPKDEVVYSAHGFLLYPLVAQAAGALAIQAAETNYTANIDALLAAVSDKTKIVFIANPNNPTGTMLAHEALIELHQNLREDIVLVVDEAYGEYVDAQETASLLSYVDSTDNLIVTRTFSKAYGLAALRLGWAYMPMEIADSLNRLRPPFNVSSLAQIAGMAALSDPQHIATTRQHNRTWRDWLRQQLAGAGFSIVPSHANFLLIEFDNPEMAAAADQHLAAQGIIARNVTAYGLPHALRLSIGTEDANRAAAAALIEFKNDRR